MSNILVKTSLETEFYINLRLMMVFILFFHILLAIFFIDIPNVNHLPSFPSTNSLSHSPSPCFYEGPSVLSLTPPLGSLCSVRWLASSIHICIGQALAEPLRRQLYNAINSALPTPPSLNIFPKERGGVSPPPSLALKLVH